MYQLHSTYFVIYLSQSSYNLVLANLLQIYHGTFSFYVKQHQKYLGLGRNWNLLLWVLYYLLSLNFLHLLQQIISLFFTQNSRIGLVPRHLACASIQIE